VSGIVRIRWYPLAAATIAKAIPVLFKPASSAAFTILIPIQSFTEEARFMLSSFTTIFATAPEAWGILFFLDMRRSQKTEFRIQNTPCLFAQRLPLGEVRGNSHGKNFFFSTIKIEGFKPRFSIQSHRIHSGFWLLNSEFFFGNTSDSLP
jgi:hypothetical protein